MSASVLCSLFGMQGTLDLMEPGGRRERGEERRGAWEGFMVGEGAGGHEAWE